MSRAQPFPQLHLRKKLAHVADRVRRATGVGNYWYWYDAPELANGIEIAALVCPLRYDVLVRRDFFAQYATHQEVYRTDFDAFVELIKQGSYYIWFTESELIRCKRDLLDTTDELEAAFRNRIRRAARLYDSVMEEGFASQFPIILKTAERLLPPTTDKVGPPTGKSVSGRYFLADGCHRLALLMASGTKVLPATYFRVKCFREFSPFDSTSLLVHRLSIEPSAYFAFLSSFYCVPFTFEHQDDFLEYIEANKPGLLAEVESIIRTDRFDTVASKRTSVGEASNLGW